jgi:predicted amino acid dehydrogenase
MRHFAFVIHPLDVELVSVAFKEPQLLNKKYSIIKKAFEWLPSFKCSDVEGVRSLTNHSLKGNLIYCSLLPEQIISLDEKFVLERVVSASKIAQDLGADIVGLGAYAAQVGRKGVSVAKALHIPLTTGTHYTIYIAIESVLSAAERVGMKVKDSNVAIIGATGGIGRICSQIFSEVASKVTLVARNKLKLERFKEDLNKISKAQVDIEENIKKVIAEADISIMATTTPVPLIDVDELKPGALICDISRPRNVSQKRIDFRKDVLVIDGGIVKPPGGEVDFNFYFGLPKGLAYACMAETMILALEEKYENYSLGGKVSAEKVKEIGELGKKHGFQLAKIRSFGNEIPEEIFDNVKNINS